MVCEVLKFCDFRSTPVWKKSQLFSSIFSVGKNVLSNSGSVRICPVVLGLHRLSCKKLAQVTVVYCKTVVVV